MTETRERNDGAVEGATSVAEAVQRVADAVIQDVQSRNVEAPPDVIVSGGLDAGNVFEVKGKGFGASGTLKINGHQVETAEWGAQRIVGKLPVTVENGAEVVVHVDDETRKVGYFGNRGPKAKK